MIRMNPEVYGLLKTMAAFMDNSSLDVSERSLMAIMLNIHTKSHTVHSRPTLKLVECFGNGLVCKLYERSIYNDPLPEATLKCLKKGQETEGICF